MKFIKTEMSHAIHLLDSLRSSRSLMSCLQIVRKIIYSAVYSFGLRFAPSSCGAFAPHTRKQKQPPENINAFWWSFLFSAVHGSLLTQTRSHKVVLWWIELILVLEYGGLYGFYLVFGFVEDCIVILLSYISIIN